MQYYVPIRNLLLNYFLRAFIIRIFSAYNIMLMILCDAFLSSILNYNVEEPNFSAFALFAWWKKDQIFPRWASNIFTVVAPNDAARNLDNMKYQNKNAKEKKASRISFQPSNMRDRLLTYLPTFSMTIIHFSYSRLKICVRAFFLSICFFWLLHH